MHAYAWRTTLTNSAVGTICIWMAELVGIINKSSWDMGLLAMGGGGTDVGCCGGN